MRQKLKNTRLEAGYTQKELADEIRISRGHYTNIELGKKDPSFKVARDIKQALGVKEDGIFLTKNVPERNKAS